MAEAYCREVEVRLANRTYVNPSAGRGSFRELADAWLDSKSGVLKPRTREGYANLLKPGRDIDGTFGGYPVDKITRQQVAEWVTARMRAGRRPSTVRNAFFLVRAVLGQAVVDGRIASNPCEHVKPPTNRASGHTEDHAHFLSPAEVEQLAAEMPWPYDVLVVLAAWTGLRAGEVAGLQVGDVDLTKRVLYVRRSLIALEGKGLSYDTPKTRRSRRVVPLPGSVCEDLAGYLAQHPRSAHPVAPLFPGTRPGNTYRLDWERPLRHSTMYGRHFRPAARRAGLVAGLRFHDLRHTYASLCVSMGLHPKQISEYMGHSNINTTMGIYAHLFEDDHTEAMARLDAARPSRAASNVVAMRR